MRPFRLDHPPPYPIAVWHSLSNEPEMIQPFTSLTEFCSLLSQGPGPDHMATADAQARNAQLTKPPAALGRLEKDSPIMFFRRRGKGPRTEGCGYLLLTCRLLAT